MAYKFQNMKIDEVCIVTDCLHKTAPSIDTPTVYRMLRTSNIRDGRLRNIDDTKSVTKEVYDKWSVRGYLEPKDVILTREAPMGEVAMISEEEDYNFFLGQRLLQLKAKKDVITPEFLYYSLQTNFLRHQIMMNEGTGSVVSNIRIPLLKKMDILVPSLHIQNKLTSILSTIEKKIRLNQRIIANLEELSQTLFKRWFIDFEFPDENGNPYKLSGGIFNKTSIGDIPRLWDVERLSSIAYEKKEKVKINQDFYDYNYIGLEHMPRGSTSLLNHDKAQRVKGKKTLFEPTDILFGKLRPNFKKVGLAPFGGVCSTDILVIKEYNYIYKEFLLNQLTKEDFYSFIVSTTTGTRMPRTNIKLILNYEIAMPPEDLIKEFHNKTSHWYKMVNNLLKENLILNESRDTLLPKLMSGEIELPEALEV